MRSPLQPLFLLYMYICSFLSLSLSIYIYIYIYICVCVFILFFPHSLSRSLFVSFAGRMSACPTDEFIFVHAFRLHRQEIYARIAVRCELLNASGIIHTPRLLDEELTTGDVFVFRLNTEGPERKNIFLPSCPFQFSFSFFRSRSSSVS